MACIWIRVVFVVALCFSCLVFMNGAVPITRSSNMMDKPRLDEPVETLFLEDMKVERRMEMEVTDYPGSGANNRHTPRAQITRNERLH
ncbi:uncharacterized protein LOC127241605 [Andrographis paniculata]|uniref:uncharacterized protein LOC127241605 n=1 Tax=Andrographis paniculata TaxID=175694 RepID=UPI0021E79D3C|nr:uncharacterized protein LOC127241605 [Andrographis paniculata]